MVSSVPAAPVKRTRTVSARAPAPAAGAGARTTRGAREKENEHDVGQLAAGLGELQLKPTGPTIFRTATLGEGAARPAVRRTATAAPPAKPAAVSSRTAGSSAAAAKAGTARTKTALLPPAEQAREHMKLVNASLSTLAEVNKSGYRHSSPPPSTPSSARLKPSSSSSPLLSSTGTSSASRVKVEAAARACGEALHGLRGLIQEGAVAQKPGQVEKAAGTLVANLVEMEMVSPLSGHSAIE